MVNANQSIQVLRGDAMRTLLHEQITQHSAGIHTALARFDPVSAVDTWMETLRAIDEFINLLLFGLDDETIEAALVALPVDAAMSRPLRFRALRHHIAYRYGEPFAHRFTTLLLQARAIGHSFARHGLTSAAMGFKTLGALVGYLQSRRRHLVALLYTFPSACIGHHPVQALDTLNEFLPLVELNGITLTGLHQQAMLAEVYPNYAIMVGPDGLQGLRDYPALDGLFLEPERASLVEMCAASPDQAFLASREPIRRDRLFSAAELRNDIRLLEVAYGEFHLADSGFGPAAAFVRCLSEFAVDDHWVSVPSRRLTELADEIGLPSLLRRSLVRRSNDYVANTNNYAPFVEIGNELRTSVTLLSRFLYHWKNVSLSKARRFQVRSGFIFEQTIAAALTAQGFTLTGIKRLNRKEFDVVTTRDGVIFNVQCKNNFIDGARLEEDVRLFARYNRALAAAYERALRKEQAREALLTRELGLSRVEHFVVTRFPIATDNPRVISFSRIDDLGDLATALVDDTAVLPAYFLHHHLNAGGDRGAVTRS